MAKRKSFELLKAEYVERYAAEQVYDRLEDQSSDLLAQIYDHPKCPKDWRPDPMELLIAEVDLYLSLAHDKFISHADVLSWVLWLKDPIGPPPPTRHSFLSDLREQIVWLQSRKMSSSDDDDLKAERLLTERIRCSQSDDTTQRNLSWTELCKRLFPQMPVDEFNSIIQRSRGIATKRGIKLQGQPGRKKLNN